MCVSIPARIVQITPGAMPMARVDVAGRAEECCVAYVPEVEVGDYVLISNGFAFDRLDPRAAAASLVAFAELGVIDLGAVDPALLDPDPTAPHVSELGGIEIDGLGRTMVDPSVVEPAADDPAVREQSAIARPGA
ncbi:MAG: HypC/HybG/HupF family hydrogenase formation chaperone [Micrococcales bacterium]|nr:HypC/HybG/HupF family hydrogenase formation chaperone [Micrococcales bacterium]